VAVVVDPVAAADGVVAATDGKEEPAAPWPEPEQDMTATQTPIARMPRRRRGA
jgi:hypothetical protein